MSIDPIPRTLLIVEDDPGLQSQLKWCFADFDVVVAADRTAAIAQLRRHEPAVITLDLGLPPDAANVSEGFATLDEILTLVPTSKVIVITGNDDRANAVKAVGAGAYDFYQKPIDADVLNLIVHRAFNLVELEQENRRLQNSAEQSPISGIIANSPQMLALCRQIEKVANSNVTTTLQGESGTGKEVIARALHERSDRAAQNFVAINCAAIPENLLESELFGYEKGAFTGAHKQTHGRIEYANGGTLFLDEVGDLPLALQAKLLRFLQERVIERLGGRGEIPVDVRVVCATHQELQALVADGRFREDLYYRITEVTLNIPPLRDRDGDPLLLAHVFLGRFNEQFNQNRRGYSEEALRAIELHPWPGNIRELENRVKRAVIMAEGLQLTSEDLELVVNQEESRTLNLRQVREAAECRTIRRALAMLDGNISRAAELLGVSRPTLYGLLKKYGI
jgi:two-component system NtrC family response regulator